MPSAIMREAKTGGLLKQCSKCKHWKKLNRDRFYVREYHPNGEPRLWSARCKQCAKIAQRQAKGHKPRKPGMTEEARRARRAELYRQRMEAIRADQARLDAHREAVRVKASLARERAGASQYRPRQKHNGRTVAGAYTGPSRTEVVDAEPLRAYIRHEFPGVNANELAIEIGYAVPDRRLREVLNGQERIELDTVDRFFTVGLGRPDVLNDVYPL